MLVKVNMLLLSLLSVLVQLCCCLPAERQPDILQVPGTVPCEQLKPYFVQNNITEFHSSTSAGSAASICESRSSCCTASMETILLKSTSREFKDALRVASHSFGQSFDEAVHAIDSKLEERLKGSMSRTLAMFEQLSDANFTKFARSPIEKLYEQLESCTKSQESSIDMSESITDFFNQVYIYMHGQGSPDYTQCVKKTQAELRPFGEIPRRLAVGLTRNLESFHALQQSMRLATQVIGETSNADLSNECAMALLRATSCAQCGGHRPSVRTCHGLCANVVRGCLAHVADVDQPWNEMLESMEKTVSMLLDSRGGSRDILASIESRLSEAVLYALENAPMLEKKVRKICGEGTTAVSATTLKGEAESGSSGEEDPVVSADFAGFPDDLGARLRTLLASARGFFAGLPDLVCSDKANRFHGQTDTECWNGQRLAEYTKPIVGTGTGAQKYNPEVRISRADSDTNFAQISDKLRHARLVLISRTVIAPEPDSLLMADFGSGSGDGDTDGSQWPGGFDSDSDFVNRNRNFDEEGSGSGDGDGDGEIGPDLVEPKRSKPSTNADLDFIDETTTRTSSKGPSLSAASSRVSYKPAFVLLIALILSWDSLRWC